jgi:hypothetical protein
MSAIQPPISRLIALPKIVEPLKASNKTLPVKDLKNNRIIFKLMSKIEDEEYINLMNSKSKAINLQHNANSRESKSKSKVQGTEASKSKASKSRESNSKVPVAQSSNSKVPGAQASNTKLETAKNTLFKKIKTFIAQQQQEREKRREQRIKENRLKKLRNILMSHGYDTRKDIHFLKELRGLLPPRTFLNSKWVAN